MECLRKQIIEEAVPVNNITDVYELQYRLGEGATATVYCGKHRENGKHHALKAFFARTPLFSAARAHFRCVTR